MCPVSHSVIRSIVIAAVATVVWATGSAPTIAGAPILVASFDFDAVEGGPDTQGWRALNQFAAEETHFHIEDFTGAGHDASPLAGNRSLWCGATVEDPQTSSWLFPPGYGRSWNENMTSQPFAVAGDVTISFLMQDALEESYDNVYLDYEAPSGEWIQLDFYNCGLYTQCAPTLQSYTVPAAAHDGSLRFRFHFQSDGAIDNEFAFGAGYHVAFVVDSLTVADVTGTVDYQDFESEAVGDTVTADGQWYAEPNRDAYSGGLLVDGTVTLQETTPVNDSWFWGFYADSDRDYGCAGYPEQLVVPESASLARSPRIDLMRDLAGSPLIGAVDSVRLTFDVYRDIATGGSKKYNWFIRSYANDLLVDFQGPAVALQGDQKDWYRQEVVIVPPAGTTTIEIDLGVENRNFNEGLCRSHAPLFDNVTVERFGGGVSAVTGPAVPGQLVPLSNSPNPFNPVTTIRFDLPRSGRVSLRIYDVAGRLVRTLHEGATLPAGPGAAIWRGVDDGGRAVASGTYFGRLTGDGFSVLRSMALVR